MDNDSRKRKNLIIALAVCFAFAALAAVWGLYFYGVIPREGAQISNEPLPPDESYVVQSGEQTLVMQTDRLRAKLCEVNSETLREYARALCKDFGNRAFNKRGSDRAARYIYDTLEAMGYTGDSLLWQDYYYDYSPPEAPPQGIEEQHGEFPEPGSIAPIAQQNIVAAYCAASDKPVLVVSAHYDCHRVGEGAVDNASGVATALELARIFRESGLEFSCELRFCFFDTEEYGYHGAAAYLDSLEPEQRSRIKACLNLDMTAPSTREGAKNRLTVATLGKVVEGSVIAGKPDKAADNAVSRTVAAVYHGAHRDIGGFVCPIFAPKNDSRPFVNRGINSATLSWREYDEQLAPAPPWLVSPIYTHTENDVFENLDLNALDDTTELALRSTLGLMFATR